MPKPKNKVNTRGEKDSSDHEKIKKNRQKIDVKVNMTEEKNSGLASFATRPTPSQREVASFDEYIENEAKEEAVDESLLEIYQDDNGKSVDVGKLEIKKRGFFSWLLTTIFTLSILASLSFIVYYYFYLPSSTDSTAVDFTIESDEEVFVGEEYIYTINYNNRSNVDLKNVVIEVKYPDNFIILDVSKESDSGKQKKWSFEKILSGQSASIDIKGRLIAPLNYSGIILANMLYTPSNFSSEFKKEASFVNSVVDTGLDLSLDFVTPVLVLEQNNISLKYANTEKNFLKNFRLMIEPLENLVFKENINLPEGVEIIRPGVYQINKISSEEQELEIPITFSEKLSDKEQVKIELLHSDTDENFKVFFEKILEIEVIKSDLSVSMIINGERTDQGVNFGDTLNYSIVYSNKGETEMKDVIIMAVLDSEFLDFENLVDLNGGLVDDNTISWTKVEIPQLESLLRKDEGIIDFSVNIIEKPNEIFPEKKYEVESYAQYNIGSSTGELIELSDNSKSNVIVNKISSDLKLNEQVRYFNEDNIAVGSGPLPPRLGEKTEFKIYWELTNNLHDLSDVSVSLTLPLHVEWGEKSIFNVGDFEYVEDTHTVTWDIGRLPISVQKVSSEFAISFVPEEIHTGKIMVLSDGARVRAHDEEADVDLEFNSDPKTTRLEDDPIAESDGIVVE